MHTSRCETAAPDSPCECSCDGEKHGIASGNTETSSGGREAAPDGGKWLKVPGWLYAKKGLDTIDEITAIRGDDEFVFQAEIEHETDNAILITPGGREVWLPRSQIEISDTKPRTDAQEDAKSSLQKKGLSKGDRVMVEGVGGEYEVWGVEDDGRIRLVNPGKEPGEGMPPAPMPQPVENLEKVS